MQDSVSLTFVVKVSDFQQTNLIPSTDKVSVFIIYLFCVCYELPFVVNWRDFKFLWLKRSLFSLLNFKYGQK